MAQQLRVGADVTAVPDVLASITRFGDRYLRAVYTDHELATCAGPDVVDTVAARSLAARFAAKEAVVKVLQPQRCETPTWRAIEVRRRPTGACEVALSGDAARLAARAGITDMALSMSHEGNVALAVVIAVGDEPSNG